MKLHFGHLLGLIATGIGACAAYMSVFGISKLFAGATVAAIIMATVLELGKFIGASYVQRYRKTAPKGNTTFVTICVVFLMVITSAGIYGFLSDAFQSTYQQFEVNENELSFLKQKEIFFSEDIARYDAELEQISNNISTLSGAKSQQIQVRDTSSVTGVRNTISTAELRAAQQRIEVEETNRVAVRATRQVANDSVQKYRLAILEKENNSDVVSELGPLKYISELSGWSMPKVVNGFMLLLIFVFDPLAVALVVATNWVFQKEGLKRRKNEPDLSEGVKKKPSMFAKLFSKRVVKQGKPTTKVVDATVDATVDAVNDAVIPKDFINNIAPTPKTPSVLPGVVQVKQTPIANTGIKPEDVAQVRNNAKNFTRKIPAKRGY